MLEQIGVTPNDVQAVSAAATVALTAVLIYVTWRYARDTRRMVDEMRRQNRPYVYLLYEEDKGATDWTTFQLTLRNAGNRVAQDTRFNIRTEALIVQFEPDHSVQDEVAWEAVAVPVSSVAVVKNGVQSLGPKTCSSSGLVGGIGLRSKSNFFTTTLNTVTAPASFTKNR